MMKAAIVGADGAVGIQLQTLCKGWELNLFRRREIPVYEGMDVAFFCAGSAVARSQIPKARRAGVLCLDASDAFRHDPDVPLVIPEINGQLIGEANGLIASPNCTATLILLPLAPIHRHLRILRIVATTFQAVSGAGHRGIRELEQQLQGGQEPTVFPKLCAHNVFLHESEVDQSGYCTEELKMQKEARKILADSTIGLTARCVRVPVFRAHAIALNVEVLTPFTLETVRNLIDQAPGVVYRDGITPLDATGQRSVFCGNLRIDPSCNNAFELWVCGDQLLKGAALNLYQLATA